MSSAPEGLRAQQLMLARWIRDPQAAEPPPGIEPRRLAVYRELVRANLDGLLSSQFPVLRRLRDPPFWDALLDGFLREHRAQTPLFPELGQEFIAYLGRRAAEGRGDPPFLVELAHYEWVELALALAEAGAAPDGLDPDGDLLDGVPVLSPLAWPLAYAWPVDRIGSAFQPETPPPQPTLLLAQRTADHAVRFAGLDPLGYRLLQRIGAEPATGRAHLVALAAEAQHALQDLLAPAATLLAGLRERGALLGALPAAQAARVP